MESRVWANSDLWKVWCWCMMKANHKEEWVANMTGRGGTEVRVRVGQFIFGRQKAAKALRMKPHSVYNRMKKLENMQNLDMKSNNHYTLVTINNWETYADVQDATEQVSEQPTNSQRTANEQPTNTYKNEKHYKNDKKKEKAAAAAVIPDTLDTAEFKSAWEEFQQHRIEIKKPATPTAMKRALLKMEPWGVERAVAALHHSTANGWTGIFEPSDQQTHGGTKHESGRNNAKKPGRVVF